MKSPKTHIKYVIRKDGTVREQLITQKTANIFFKRMETFNERPGLTHPNCRCFFKINNLIKNG